MRRFTFVLFVLGGLTLAAPDQPARAQPVGPELNYSKHRQFYIPFSVGPGKERLWQLQLYVSVDQGKTWQHAASAGPELGKFQYFAESEGLHLFAVKTIDVDNRSYPATLENVTPHAKVIVDTIKPAVHLKQLSARDGVVGVSWTIEDANFDGTRPDAFRLDFRPVGTLGWTPLLPRVANQVYWNPETNAPLEVRLRARDRAGNEGQDTIKITPGENPIGGVQGTPPEKKDLLQSAPRRSIRIAKLINSTSISLNFEIKDKGPSWNFKYRIMVHPGRSQL